MRMAKEKQSPVQKRKWWFRCMKKMMKCRYKRPTFVYFGEKFGNGAVVLSNHEGTDAPLSLEMYCDKPIRMWGAWEMNSGLIKMYKYQTRVYYHEKKHWNLFLARMFCLIASPLTNLFYKGLHLISTYRDARFMKTLRQSVDAIANGDNVVIFPEHSEDGYLAELKGFYSGFIVFAQQCYKEGIDVPIYVSYYKLKEKTYVFDKPIKFSELKAMFTTRDEMSNYLLEKCNSLGKMEVEPLEK